MPTALEPVQTVARKLVRAGHAALLKKNHPDAGGTESAMKAINLAREWLDAMIDDGKAPSKPAISPDPNQWFWDMADNIAAAAEAKRSEREQRRANGRASRDAQEGRKTETTPQEDIKIRVEGPWALIEGVTCVNQNPKSICCSLNGQVYWIPRSELRTDSEVQHRGDRGTLILKLAIARRLGIVSEQMWGTG